MYFTFLIPNLSLVHLASLCFPSTFATCEHQFSPDFPIFEAFKVDWPLTNTWKITRVPHNVPPPCRKHDEMWMVCMICKRQNFGDLGVRKVHIIVMLSISSEAEAVKRHGFFAYQHIIFPSNEVPWPTTWQLFWRRFLRCCLEHPGMLGWLVDCTVQHASCRWLNVYYLMNWNDPQYELLVKLHSWWLLYSSVSWLGKKSKNIQLDRWGLFPPAKVAP